MLVALGGNLPSRKGSPASTISCAIRRLSAKGLMIRAISRFFVTPCFPAGAGPDFINAVISAETWAGAAEALAILHDVEQEFGRQRKGRWGARTLDLDLLAVGQEVLPDSATQLDWMALNAHEQIRKAPEQLILPHPRLHQRAFVLVPLLDICPDWKHPVLGTTVRQMAEALPPGEIDAVRPI